MELQIEIHDVSVDSRTIQGNRGEFTIREQSGWLQLPDEPHPRAIKFQLDRDADAYPAGEYIVSPKSIYINRYGFAELRKQLILVRRAGRKSA